MAKKYFGTTDVIGKIIEADKTPYKITAVIKDIPHNSHFAAGFIFSMDNVDYSFGNFLSHNFQTYIKLREGVDYKLFENNFKQVIQKHVFPQAQQFMKLGSMDEFEKSGNKLEYHLMPLTDIHLHSDRFPELAANGSIQYVYIFSAVAFFILLIACINFMNLSTARSASRAKEVGIRKVLGTERKDLVRQFLTESTVMVFISLLFALGIVYFVLPLFNNLAAKQLTIGSFFNLQALPFILILPLAVGVMAGLYPAIFLSGFKPAVVLKGKINAGFRKNALRSGLVIVQFATSIVLIIATFIVYSQLNYIRSTNLGFNKDQVLIVDGTRAFGNNQQAFRNGVEHMACVYSGTISSFLPVSNSSRNDNTYSTSPVLDPTTGINMQTWGIDYDYLETMGMQVLKGRNFSREFGADSSAVLITEVTSKLLGYGVDPVGRKLYASDVNGTNATTAYTIIGVVKDFHFESLREHIGPLCFRLSNNDGGAAIFKVSADNINTLVKQVADQWKKMAPAFPFSYRFLDESFDTMYRAEQRAGSIAITFSVLAIFIACLGLFGLVTYMAEQRTKEIGVRKVLGASTGNLVGMLSKDFLRLVAVAALIAFPLAWWAMHAWLQDFAYRISMPWWVFFVAGGLALVIALVTVSFQALKAAAANPVQSLRTE